MAFNKDVIDGKWTQIKGEIQKVWGQITDDEVEKTKGDLKAIEGLVLQKHGQNKQAFEERFSKILDQVSDS